MRPRLALAGADGRTYAVTACCDVEVTLSPTDIRVAHDDGCPALRPDGHAERAAADLAVACLLVRLGVCDDVVVMEVD